MLACTNWFALPGVPALIIGPVRIVDGRGELVLSVANMPGGRLASLMVATGGLTVDLSRVANVTIEGLNGFEVLASQLWGDNDGFGVSHPSTGLADGEVVRLTCTTWRDVTLDDFALDESCISLGGAQDHPIQVVLSDEGPHSAE